MYHDWDWTRMDNELLAVNDRLVLLGRCDRQKVWKNGKSEKCFANHDVIYLFKKRANRQDPINLMQKNTIRIVSRNEPMYGRLSNRTYDSLESRFDPYNPSQREWRATM